MAASASMIAFFAARARGTGQHVDVSLMETQMGSIDRRMSELLAYEYNQELTPRMDIAGMLQYPYGIFPCADGYVDVAGGFMFLNRIERVLEMSLMENYGSAYQFDVERREEFLANIWYPWVMERSRKEIVEICQERRVISAPINTTEDLLNEPQFQGRGFWAEADHPVVGKLTYPGRPALSDELHWEIRKTAPLLGEHNEEVYMSMGYTAEDLLKLREGGVI
jgi:benzylsuccinate CoA-transferase BbsE subunit